MSWAVVECLSSVVHGLGDSILSNEKRRRKGQEGGTRGNGAGEGKTERGKGREGQGRERWGSQGKRGKGQQNKLKADRK